MRHECRESLDFYDLRRGFSQLPEKPSSFLYLCGIGTVNNSFNTNWIPLCSKTTYKREKKLIHTRTFNKNWWRNYSNWDISLKGKLLYMMKRTKWRISLYYSARGPSGCPRRWLNGHVIWGARIRATFALFDVAGDQHFRSCPLLPR